MVDDLLNTDGISKEYLVILKQIEDYCNRGPEIDLDSQGITCGKWFIFRKKKRILSVVSAIETSRFVDCRK